MNQLTFLLLLCLGSCLIVLPLQAQEQDDPSRWTPEDIIYTEYLRSPVFSPDNRMVVWTKSRAVKDKDKFVSDLYLTRLDLQKDGSFRTIQLTRADESDHSPFFSHDGEKIYFLSSREKGKKLWSLSIYGGEPEEVHEFKEGISDPRRLNDSTLVYLSEEGATLYEEELKEKKDNTVVVEDSVHWKPRRLYTYSLASKKEQRLTDNAYRIAGYQVSHDGQWLVYSLIRSPHYGADAQPKPTHHLIDLRSGTTRTILAGLQTPGNFQFTADDSGFYFTSVLSSDPQWNGSGVNALHFYRLSDHQRQTVDLDWALGMEGQYKVIGQDVLVELANGPLRKLAFYHRQGDQWVKSDMELGDKSEHVTVLTVADNYRKAIYEHSTAAQLPRYYVADLQVENGKLNWTNEKEVTKLNQKLKKKPLARYEVLRWKGYNNDEVTGILYYPENYQAGQRYPLMLSIHGGPSGVDLDAWRERWSTYPQLLSQRGAFVLKPNYHGSSHHGQEFVESIKHNYYTPEIADINAALDLLDERGMIDMDQLGTMGWSNGAIITTMLTVRHPDKFKVACPGAGDVNWTSDFGTCRFGVSFDQSYFGGAPYDDVDGKFYNEQYIVYSPLFELDKVKTPTIIFHGSEDRAVPRDQGWEYYRALQQIGQAPVRFLWFPDQPHGLRKITHQLRKMKEELDWIDTYLFDKKPERNEAFKKESPLAMLLKKDQALQHDGRYGDWQKGKLLPEVVAVAKDSIAVGRFEVTNAQFAEFDPKFSYPVLRANYPAQVSFAQAQAYVAWLSRQTGRPYRLPKAKEAKSWHQLALKQGAKENTLNYWAGYSITADEVPLLRQKLKEAKATLLREVGQFPPAKVGAAEVFDLAGNLAEYQENGKSYGFSAYDYVDSRLAEHESPEEYTGFRVVKDN